MESAIQLAMSYLVIQGLLTLTFFSLKSAQAFLSVLKVEVTAQFWKQAHHLALVTIIVFPLLTQTLVDVQLFRPPVQVWSEVKSDKTAAFTEKDFAISFTPHPTHEELRVQTKAAVVLSSCLLAIVFGLWCFHLSKLFLSFFQIRKLTGTAFKIRQLGKISIFLADSAKIPFVASLGRRVAVVMPTELLSRAHCFKLALAHEFQHLKSLDHLWVYVLEIYRAFFYANPFVHQWIEEIEELHEFACDEALLGQQKVNKIAYSRCLLEVAEYAQTLGHTEVPSGSVGMSVAPNQLKRRIEMILKVKVPQSVWIARLAVLFALTTTGAAAIAAKGVVADRRMTLAEAQQLAEKSSIQTGIPISVDENVLKHLNKGVGTERGRMYLRATLKRMKAYESMIGKKLAKAGLPEELLAIPIVESGYQNNDNGIGAGLWAFIPSTARHYGLKVTDDLDERFDIEKETDAAVKYYTKLYQEFNDWPLALLAYNAGESSVREAISRTGIRDALRLVREKHLKKEQDYLPMTFAALIVFKNPTLIQD